MTRDQPHNRSRALVTVLRTLGGESGRSGILPTGGPDLDAAGLAAWVIVGLDLFVDGLPVMERVRVSSWHLMAALAMLRSRGSLSHAARMLGTSRRTLREGLRAAGLYPWHGEGEPGREPSHDPGNERIPGLAFMLRELPDVLEDGTPGVVWFTPTEPDGIGPAWLERGDQSERLFRGWWVDRELVEAYAAEYGHDVHCDEQAPTDPSGDHGR